MNALSVTNYIKIQRKKVICLALIAQICLVLVLASCGKHSVTLLATPSATPTISTIDGTRAQEHTPVASPAIAATLDGNLNEPASSTVVSSATKTIPISSQTVTATPVIIADMAAVVSVPFAPARGGRPTLFLIDSDGKIRSLENEDWYDVSDVAFTPDGQYLYAKVLHLDGSKGYLIPLDTAVPTPFSLRNTYETSGSEGRWPAWSPEGEHIAFVVDRDYSGVDTIYIGDIDGGVAKRLIEGEQPSWSPDSRHLTFITEKEGPQPTLGQLHRIAVDGTDKRILAPDLYAGASSWSPDGKWIAFYAHDGKSMERSWGVYVVSSEGGEPVWMGKGTEYAPPAWLPDSTHLLIPHKQDLFMVGLDGERERVANWPLSEFNIIDILLRPTP